MMKPFIIRTDQQSLKHLLDHKLSTPFQQKWLSKLAGLDYNVEYKKGAENKVADALSRVAGAELSLMAITSVHTTLFEEIQLSWSMDPNLKQLISELADSSRPHPHYTWEGEQLRRKGKLVVGFHPELRKKILQWLHASPQGGHSGIEATVQRVKSLFFWSGLKADVRTFVKECTAR